MAAQTSVGRYFVLVQESRNKVLAKGHACEVLRLELGVLVVRKRIAADDGVEHAHEGFSRNVCPGGFQPAGRRWHRLEKPVKMPAGFAVK
jgi:hypothetical protein